MRHVPNFVLKRNRRDSYAEEQARGYTDPVVYLVDAGDGRGPVQMTLHAFRQQMIEQLTARDNRLIGQLRPGEAMDLYGVTLHCCLKVEWL